MHCTQKRTQQQKDYAPAVVDGYAGFRIGRMLEVPMSVPAQPAQSH